MVIENEMQDKGSVREVIRLSWPIVVSMLSYTAMGVTDTLFVGWLGKAEVGAVGLAVMAIFLVNSFAMGLLEGVKVVSAQATGAGNTPAARAAAWQGVWIALPMGACVIAMAGLSDPIFQALGGSAAVRSFAKDYFFVRVFSAPLWYATLAFCNGFQGMGDTKTPMRVNLLANGLNVALDPVFIFGLGPIPAMGVKGAAFATVLACGLGLVYALHVYMREHGFIARVDSRVLREILRLGWPMGIRFVLDVSAWTAFTSLLARIGDDDLAANQIVISIIKVSFLPGYGISQAACILTGNYTGARDWARVRRSFRSALIVAVAVMAFCGLFFWLVPGWLILCFQSDPEVLRIGTHLLWVAAFFQVFDAVAMVAFGALNGTGDTRYTLMVSVSASWLILIPSAYVLGVVYDMGALGGWLGLTVQIIVVAALLTRRFRREGWRNSGTVEAITARGS